MADMEEPRTDERETASIEDVAWLERRLAAARRRHNCAIRLGLLGLTLSAAVAILLLYGVLDYAVRFPGVVRVALTVVVAVAVWFTARRMHRRAAGLLRTAEDVVRRVEAVKAAAGESQRSLLVSALEFGRRPAIGGSTVLKNEAIRLARDGCVNPALVRLYDAGFARRAALAVAAAAVVAGFAIGPGRGHARAFLVRMWGAEADYPTATRLVSVEWAAHAPMRVDYPVTVRARGRLPAAGTLLVESGERRRYSLPLEADETEPGVYHALVPTPMESFRFGFRLGDYRSERFAVALRAAPAVAAGAIEIEPPAYTRLPRRELPLQGLSVPEGSRLRFTVKPNVPVRECALILAGAATAMVPAGDDGYAADVTARESASFSIRLQDEFGVENAGAPEYRLAVAADRPPEPSMIKPDGAVFRSNMSRLDLEVAARDDYGLESLSVAFTILRTDPKAADVDRNTERAVKTGSIPLPGPADVGERSGRVTWLVREFGAQPGDRVALQAVARDNRPDAPQEVRSDPVALFVVSPEEMREIVAREKEQVSKLLVKLRDDERRQLAAVKERIKQP